MKYNVTVEVRHSDIQRFAETRDKCCKNCPVAIALSRAAGGQWGVSRSGAFCKLYQRVAFPELVTRWIDRLDNGERVKPLSFPLVLERI